MPLSRLSQSLLLAATLGIAACSTSYACTDARSSSLSVHVGDGLICKPNGGDDPKSSEAVRTALHVRDSVFHSYLDSLDYRITELHRAAHEVDSLARLFTNGQKQLHMEGRSFGPVSIPPMTFPSPDPNSDVTIPSVESPAVEVPAIVVPSLDLNDGFQMNDRPAPSRLESMTVPGNKTVLRTNGVIYTNGSTSSIVGGSGVVISGDVSSAGSFSGITGPTNGYINSSGTKYYIMRPGYSSNGVEKDVVITQCGNH